MKFPVWGHVSEGAKRKGRFSLSFSSQRDACRHSVGSGGRERYSRTRY